MDLTGKNILVTGSEGFIGSHLTERLVSLGANVTAFVLYNSFNNWGWIDTFSDDVKKKIQIFSGNIQDELCVREAVKGKDIVFHLAALIAIPYSYYAPYSYVETNIKGTLNVLQSCREFNTKKLVHTSTSEVYGTALYVPIDENHPLQGQSPYSASKISADMMAESYFRSFGTPVATARPFNTYGPRQSARAVIPTIITQILSGAKEIKLGSLLPTRDLNYVEDTVNGFIEIALSNSTIGRVTNICTGNEISIGDLANKIIGIMNKDVSIICDSDRLRPKNSEVERLCGNNKNIMAYTNWKNNYSLEEGLTKTIDWISNNLKYYKANIYNI